MDTRAKCNDLLTFKTPPPLWAPFTGHNMAPWVKVWFIGGNYCVSVGNDSMRGGVECKGEDLQGAGRAVCCDAIVQERKYVKNRAVIKSFQYGFATNGGDGIKVEIVDEQGSEFCNFLTNWYPKNRDKTGPKKGDIMAFQFGWITTDCKDPSRTCTYLSRKRKCVPSSVDVSFTGAAVRFTINGMHPAELIVAGVNVDRELEKMRLKPAIIKLFDIYQLKPLFLSAIKNHNCETASCFDNLKTSCEAIPIKEKESYPIWKFSDNEDCDGAFPGSAGWKTHGKGPIDAAKAWLDEKTTDNVPKRGFVVSTCNLLKDNPTVIFWESPKRDCKGKKVGVPNYGTYIVNGGPCSSVISFNPKINWNVPNLSSGGSIGNTNQKASFAEKECKISGEGTEERLPVSETTEEQFGRAAGAKAVTSAKAANRAMPQVAGVEAELIIQGNPYFDDPVSMTGAEIAILVYNSFVLRLPLSGRGCMDWLADPPINAFLSNKNWQLQGISHEIKEGSFTTNLKVQLLLPGFDFDKKVQLGGEGGPYCDLDLKLL